MSLSCLTAIVSHGCNLLHIHQTVVRIGTLMISNIRLKMVFQEISPVNPISQVFQPLQQILRISAKETASSGFPQKLILAPAIYQESNSTIPLDFSNQNAPNLQQVVAAVELGVQQEAQLDFASWSALLPSFALLAAE